ncbi:MAG: methylated-DNA--[protein]-cysteine S-methyltransferase [Planctomycetota bacterium]|nr:methylated-DNA--[protein]-cysteine S-methyltransferase [Planctomycetota bacterium]
MTHASDYARIADAIRFLDERRGAQPSLDEVAARMGSSAFHAQRLFKRFAGVSPKRFLQFASAEAAKQRLVEARTVLDTTFDVGLSSPGRLHDLLVSVEAVTPGEVKSGGAGLTLRYGRHETPFGPARIATSERGIVRLSFQAPEDDDLASLRRAWPEARLVRDDRTTAPLIERIFARRDGDDCPLPLLLRGTNLQVRVWEALLRIPEGAVVSYGSLATALGRPTAARAVASAVGANEIAYLIPCHRVLRATGALGGYRWGVERKRVLLAAELSRCRPAPAR